MLVESHTFLAKLAVAHDRTDLVLRNRAAEHVTYQVCRERWSRR